MPPLPNRTDEESELASLLLVLLQDWQADALAKLGDPPEVANLGPAFFADHARRVRDAIMPVLAASMPSQRLGSPAL